jgi:RNA polymerase sigma-70 factor (ECF subfamily)
MKQDPAKISRYDQWNLWADAAQKGDKKAYALLLKDITPHIKSVIHGIVANSDWVDDLTQNILISVHKSLNTYSPDRPFKPWLSAIINFRHKDFLRAHYAGRKNKHAPYDEAIIDKQCVTNTDHAGEYKDIEAALSELPDKQRKIFTKIKLEGYTAKEVANQMHMSVTAVKVSAHRTMTKIKEKLE